MEWSGFGIKAVVGVSEVFWYGESFFGEGKGREVSRGGGGLIVWARCCKGGQDGGLLGRGSLSRSPPPRGKREYIKAQIQKNSPAKNLPHPTEKKTRHN